MRQIPAEIIDLMALFEQELRKDNDEMAIVRAYGRYLAGERMDMPQIARKHKIREPDYHSKEYIGFAGEWAKGVRRDRWE